MVQVGGSSGSFDPGAEFDRQVELLAAVSLVGRSGAELATRLKPLRDLMFTVAGTSRGQATAAAPPDVDRGEVPFVLVVTDTVATVADAVPLLRVGTGAKPGIIDRNFRPGEPAAFRPVVELPEGHAYLITGVQRGDEFRNLPPRQAMDTLAGRGRTPLTIDEGIALARAIPGILARNKCFSLAGSGAGDKRVPALWISQGAPKLGWCYAGVPHTWLGLASCASRLGAGVELDGVGGASDISPAVFAAGE